MVAIDPGPRPELHRAASHIANRIVFLLHRVVRQGEHEQAVRSIYALAREEIEAMSTQGEMPPGRGPAARLAVPGLRPPAVRAP